MTKPDPFVFKAAKRENVGLLVSLAGGDRVRQDVLRAQARDRTRGR